VNQQASKGLYSLSRAQQESQPESYKRSTCRACGGMALRTFLSLGPTPLANSFLRSETQFREEASYPLDVCFCEDCSLVQLLDVIDPNTLFRNYIYVTGTSETMAAHNARYSRDVVELLKLKAGELIVEVASNDGSLLKCFRQSGAKTLGIEPAENIAEIARANGIETVNHFFNSMTASRILNSHGPARAIIANNVLAHVDDTGDFLGGCKELLDRNGLLVIEVPYVRDLIQQLEYDTIYHEHLCYFSVSALLRLCGAAGLSIIRIDHVSVHGGSLRMYAGARADYGDHSENAIRWAELETRDGLNGPALYHRFAGEVSRNRTAVRDMLISLKGAGKTVAGYGAPAKGNTLLNYCGIDAQLIPYTVDKNPMKIGRYTPGMHIPVLPVSTLFDRQPDYVLILAWNFAAEIIEQQMEYRSRGGRFITPIPEPRIL
jgi:C-methyltransferase C-terminal domain/Putative zinc binding domain/Methyltransferase domain